MIEEDKELNGKIQIADPVIIDYGRYFGAVVNFGEDSVILRLQFTPKTLVTNLRACSENRKDSRDKFATRMQEVGLETKNRNSYGWMPGWQGNGLAFDNCSPILERIRETVRKFFPQNF